MAYSLQDTSDLTALGNAIRAKTGGSSNMTVAEMATAVSGISSGGGSLQVYSWTSTTKINNVYYWVSSQTGSSASSSVTKTFTANNIPSKFSVYGVLGTNAVDSSPSNSYYNTAFRIDYNNGTYDVYRYGYSPSNKVTITASRTSSGTVTITFKLTGQYSYMSLWGPKSGENEVLRLEYVE